ncbi:MAG: cytoplasmic protein [Phycisphaerae bacterium]|nr:cytoplasmic protein [Phycisphaerae bacterium]
MEEFVSEPIEPVAGTFDTAAMARGEPGLPAGFLWHGEKFDVLERLETWKQSSPEGGRHDAEVYLRRHYYRLRMSDGAIWTVYFTRQARAGGSPRRRWFLYSKKTGTGEPPPGPVV